jgi:UPF0755 protein
MADNLGMTIEEIIIIESIIEREVPVTAIEQRPLVASLIYNRLAADMPLQMYSTLVYAVNRRLDMLEVADYNNPSPYNTFRHAGLPIGPISNPGRTAIMAALQPARTNYLFMLVADSETGALRFFTNYGDFAAALEAQNNEE